MYIHHTPSHFSGYHGLFLVTDAQAVIKGETDFSDFVMKKKVIIIDAQGYPIILRKSDRIGEINQSGGMGILHGVEV